MEHNNGVYYSERLQPVPAEAGAGAWATGVKRSADKVCAPTGLPTPTSLLCTANVLQAPSARAPYAGHGRQHHVLVALLAPGMTPDHSRSDINAVSVSSHAWHNGLDAT